VTLRRLVGLLVVVQSVPRKHLFEQALVKLFFVFGLLLVLQVKQLFLPSLLVHFVFLLLDKVLEP
jgi:hypothetical protein